MSVVIIGGHDRMTAQYKDICDQHDCKMKLFTQIPCRFKDQIGCPDLIVLFTSTVSHKMVKTALKEAKKNNIKVARSHSSSGTALKKILNTYKI